MEWIWYTNSEHFRKLKLEGRIWTAEALGAWVRKRVQKHDEHVLVEPFHEDFAGREEPDIYEILECARPYLPREGAFGEMVLNVGKVVYLAKKGAAGIIDISPFTCMNGIVCEAIYPAHQPRPGRHPDPQFLFRRHAVRPGPRLGRLHGTGAELPEETGIAGRGAPTRIKSACKIDGSRRPDPIGRRPVAELASRASRCQLAAGRMFEFPFPHVEE